MSWIIYKHTNLLNNKCYIGQTKQDPLKRWRNGDGYLTDGSDTHFGRAIRKYGWDSFLHEIIENEIETIEKANERETFWINFYDSVHNGYNSNFGGGNRQWSEESKLKASLTHKGKKITGLHLIRIIEAAKRNAKNPERNKKISEALTGRTFTDEHRHILSEIAKTKTGTKNPFYGKHHDDKTIEKYKEEFGKEVVCLETGAYFISANEAGRILGVTGGSIRASCRLGIQTKIGNKWFHFYYKEEEKPEFKENNIREVINLETNEIFENLHEAAKTVNKTSKLIGMCCRNVIDTAGGYHWMYFDDFKKLSLREIEIIKSRNIIGKGRKKSVTCIETSKNYKSVLEASKITGICHSSICKCINGIQETAGGYHWK